MIVNQLPESPGFYREGKFVKQIWVIRKEGTDQCTRGVLVHEEIVDAILVGASFSSFLGSMQYETRSPITRMVE